MIHIYYIVCSPTCTCVISGQRVSAVEGWDPRKRRNFVRGGSGDWCVLWVHVDAPVRHFAGPFIIGLLADLCFGVVVPVHTKDQCMMYVHTYMKNNHHECKVPPVTNQTCKLKQIYYINLFMQHQKSNSWVP